MGRYNKAVKVDVRRRMSPSMRQCVAQISAEHLALKTTMLWYRFCVLVVSHGILSAAAAGGAGNPQLIPELAGSGAIRLHLPRRAHQCAGHRAQASAVGLLVPQLFYQVDVAGLCSAICDSTIAQIPCGAYDLDQLVCDGKTLRGSNYPPTFGGSVFIAQVPLFSAALSIPIINVTPPVRSPVLRQFLDELDLESMRIQSDALHTQQPFFGTSRCRGPTSC